VFVRIRKARASWHIAADRRSVALCGAKANPRPRQGGRVWHWGRKRIALSKVDVCADCMNRRDPFGVLRFVAELDED